MFKMATSVMLILASVFSYADNDLRGIWKSKGYGYYLDFSHEEVDLYEFTKLSCLKSGLQTGKVNYSNKYQTGSFAVTIPGFINADMNIVETQDLNKKRVHRTDTNTYFDIERISELPLLCQRSADTSAQYTNKVFTQNFIEHYLFLDKNKKTTFEQSLMAEVSKENLFDALVDKVASFKDPHIALVAASSNQYYFGNEHQPKPTANISTDDIQSTVNSLIGNIVLHETLNKQLVYGNLTPEIGYLAIKGFSNFKAEANTETEQSIFNNVLNKVFNSFKGNSSLIIDVRNNSGGSDKLALQLASRLTNQTYFAYAKQAVESTNNGQIRWTTPNASSVVASENPGFFGKIVMLTNRQTISAGETFVMATMERQPKVTRIGTATAGHFSDMLPRTLPNGWLFALPNERFIDKNGRSYDKSGIPAHTTTYDTELKDASLLSAISYLNDN